MMKVVFITNIFLPEGTGGGERVVAKRAKERAAIGDKVTIIVPSEIHATELYDTNITVLRFKPIHLFVYKNAVQYPWIVRLLWHIVDTFNIFTYLQVKKMILRLQPDEVECHNLKGVGMLIPGIFKSRNIRHTLYLHDVQLSIPSGILFAGKEKQSLGFFQIIYEKIVKSTIGSPDIVYSPSKWLLGFYTKKGFFKQSKKITLPKPDMDLQAIERKYVQLLTRDERSFVYVGKLETFKGIALLLRAWKYMPETYRLSIYGTGALLNLVIQAAKNSPNITFYGHKDKDTILNALKEADMLVMPTLCYENRPEVILESLSVGTPVIASGIGGISELIIQEKTGMLIPPGDETALISSLKNDRQK